ncbi:MAG: hypothetical protein EXR37_09280 [Limnohabitans sp.]|nr:hypothetical protein [Limnohabitans sp.]
MNDRFRPALDRLSLCALVLMMSTSLAGANDSSNSQEYRQAQEDVAHGNTSQRINGLNRLSRLGTAADAAYVYPLLSNNDLSVRSAAQSVIWQLWGHSGNADIDRQYEQALDLMNAGDLTHAIEMFSSIIEQLPSFAEPWNKRATIYFMIGQYDLSIMDCEEVLKRVPQHFGALSGYARMLINKGQFERALDYMERANLVNPQMPNAAEMIQQLRKQISTKKDNIV